MADVFQGFIASCFQLQFHYLPGHEAPVSHRLKKRGGGEVGLGFSSSKDSRSLGWGGVRL